MIPTPNMPEIKYEGHVQQADEITIGPVELREFRTIVDEMERCRMIAQALEVRLHTQLNRLYGVNLSTEDWELDIAEGRLVRGLNDGERQDKLQS